MQYFSLLKHENSFLSKRTIELTDWASLLGTNCMAFSGGEGICWTMEDCIRAGGGGGRSSSSIDRIAKSGGGNSERWKHLIMPINVETKSKLRNLETRICAIFLENTGFFCFALLVKYENYWEIIFIIMILISFSSNVNLVWNLWRETCETNPFYFSLFLPLTIKTSFFLTWLKKTS